MEALENRMMRTGHGFIDFSAVPRPLSKRSTLSGHAIDEETGEVNDTRPV
jgi:hypothetical protein